VLDVGAGSCPYRPLFAHCRYERHDCEPLQGNGHSVIDHVSDITAIPVGDRTFDVALCTEVLEHVPDPVAAVKELARILRPGGRLILTAPLASGLHQSPTHFFGGFTPFWYRRYLGDAGFEDIEIEANGGFFKFYGQESQRFNVMLHPSRFRGAGKAVAALAWAATLPVCRVMIPILCHWLDRVDTERSFTIGYHVSAVRR
jgi:SAM-dependent methyltransferase